MLSFISIYGTSKEVKLLDRRLGMLHLLCLLIVLFYVVGVRLIIEKGYQTIELSHGTIAVTLSVDNSSEAAGWPYYVTNGLVSPADESDLVQPLKEGAALFLATSKYTTPLQKLDNCTDPAFRCQVDGECAHEPPFSYGVCDESSGMCLRQSWCPQPSTPGAHTTLSTLEGLDRLALTLMGTIDFPRIDSGATFTTEDGRPSRVTWDIPEVLKRGGVDQVELMATGGVLSLVLKWSCQVGLSFSGTKQCIPRLRVYDIGQGSGFHVNYAHYYQKFDGAASDGAQPVPHRDLFQATGIRFLVSSRGIARKIDLYACVIQLFVALALLPIASQLADAIMQNLFSERRHYREYKTETTPDFSDVRAKVEQLDKQNKQQQEKMLAYGDEA